MIDAGSRYKNLEKSMGMGVTLVLGTDIPETTWARVLPKKDGKFDQVIAHLRTTPLAEMSLKYSNLRARVIDHQLDIFNGLVSFVPNVQAGFSGTTMATDPVVYNNSCTGNYPFTENLIDYSMLGMVNGYDNQWIGADVQQSLHQVNRQYDDTQ